MKKLYSTVHAITLILMIATPSTVVAKESTNFAEGDEFSYNVLSAESGIRVNGTNYSNNIDVEEGSEIDVVVNNIDDADADDEIPFFEVSDTFVNVTETIDGDEEERSTWLDGWFGIFAAGLLIAVFSGFGYPDFYSFDEPDTDDTEEDSTAAFPYFASANETRYEEFEDDIRDLEEEDIEADEFSADARFDQEEQTFTANFHWLFTNTTTNSDGLDASFELTYDFDLEIDFEQGIITLFDMFLQVDIEIGDGRSVLTLDIALEEAGGLLSFLPLPNVAFFLMILSSLALIVRRRK